MANSFYKDAQKVFDNDKKYVEIPKGATNGDMIKVMFPNEYKYFYDRSYSDWWNAPYKKGTEE